MNVNPGQCFGSGQQSVWQVLLVVVVLCPYQVSRAVLSHIVIYLGCCLRSFSDNVFSVFQIVAFVIVYALVRRLQRSLVGVSAWDRHGRHLPTEYGWSYIEMLLMLPIVEGVACSFYKCIHLT